MFKTTSAAFAALLASAALSSAFAAGATVKAGQYYGVTQYTAVTDITSPGLCAAIGIKQGNVTTQVATVAGLGLAWTETIADSNPNAVSAYGVSWTNCAFSAMPAATTFKATTLAKGVVLYTAAPTTASTTACLSSTGATYSLVSQNGTASDGTVQTGTYTVTPAQAGSGNYAFKVTTTNSLLTVSLPAAAAPIFGTTTIQCYLSTDGLYSNTKL